MDSKREVSTVNLQNGLEDYRSKRQLALREFNAIRVLRKFRMAHDLTISDLAGHLKLSRSTTQRLCQYGTALKYNAETWDKVYAFVENLPPIQKKLF